MRAATFFLICLLLAPAGASHAGAILNTLRAFDGNEPGMSGDAEASFSQSGGNTELLSLAAGGRLQWQGERHRWRTMASIQKESSDGTETERNQVLHLRHNSRLIPRLHSLVFAQYQKNPFQRLRSRILLGAGGRFDLRSEGKWHASVGAAHMSEWEEIENESPSKARQRLSTFLSVMGKLSGNLSVDLSAFYQPLWSDFEDARAVASAAAIVSLGGGFSLVLQQSVEHDSNPPTGVEQTDWKFQTGLKYSF